MKNKEYLEPSMKRTAICGLFCPSCENYVYTNENILDKLEAHAKRNNASVEDIKCHGCRSSTLTYYCRENCYMKKCAKEKNIEFCSECAEYPCAQLKDFQTALPHRIELYDNLERIRQAGYEQWYIEMLKHYACPNCDTINTAYDAECRNCGQSPSCEYVETHGEKINEMIQKR